MFKVAKVVTNNENGNGTSRTKDADTVWVEGLVPGIDFCNHGAFRICVVPHFFCDPFGHSMVLQSYKVNYQTDDGSFIKEHEDKYFNVATENCYNV